MRKFILLTIFLYLGWEYYVTNNGGTSITEVVNSRVITPLKARFNKRQQKRFSTNESYFECDGRQYCKQMTSIEEAYFFNRNCPNTDLDSDYDGELCEGDPRF